MTKGRASAAVLAWQEQDVPPGFERVTIRRRRGTNLRFYGELLAKNEAKARPRWFSIALWQTKGGQWIAQTTAHSEVQGEVPIEDAIVLDAGDWQGAMDFWDWSGHARQLARSLGWSLDEFVD